MKITIPTEAYNSNRYFTPYIAVLDFNANPKGNATFGDWVGQPGDKGLLILADVPPGSTIMAGQKAKRGKSIAPEYRQALPDGTLSDPISKADAYALSLEHPAESPAMSALNELAARLNGAPPEVLEALAVVRGYVCES